MTKDPRLSLAQKILNLSSEGAFLFEKDYSTVIFSKTSGLIPIEDLPKMLTIYRQLQNQTYPGLPSGSEVSY